MTTFESAITRAESDLAHMQSALDTAQQVLEVADRAHRTGHRLVRALRVVTIVSVVAGIAVLVAMLFSRLSTNWGRQQRDETSDAT
jgi:hypothetical protein